jgi:hypothetical protein
MGGDWQLTSRRFLHTWDIHQPGWSSILAPSPVDDGTVVRMHHRHLADGRISNVRSQCPGVIVPKGFRVYSPRRRAWTDDAVRSAFLPPTQMLILYALMRTRVDRRTSRAGHKICTPMGRLVFSPEVACGSIR